MNDLLYFNNNTPNYEYILKDIIIDNKIDKRNAVQFISMTRKP